MDDEFAGAIPVQSVAEEYCLMGQERCSCGGRYHPQVQALLSGKDGRHYDQVQATCERCDAERTFLFDVSAFYGR